MKSHLTKIVTTLLLGVLLSVSLWGKDKAFYFVKDGKTDLVIVMPQKPSPALKKRLDEFVELVKKSTGAAIPLVQKPLPGKKNMILSTGKYPVAEEDNFTILFPNEKTIEIKGSQRAAGHALEYLLENAFNIRRLTKNYVKYYWRDRPARVDRSLEVSCEEIKTASIPRKKITEKPSFNLKRHLYTHMSGWKNRISFPGTHDLVKWAFPPAKYAPKNTWPKEIIPIHNGKPYKMPIAPKRNQWGRFRVHWQPCWTNPASTKIAIANILEQLKKEKKTKNVYSINLDINDNGGHCRCKTCLAGIKKRTSTGHTNYSNIYWKWVNTIATEVTKVYPDLYFNALAYREVIDPPDFKLHPNVIPQICRELTATIDPKVKKTIENLLESWSKKCSVIFLWDYQYGESSYLFPRIYFHRQAELFKMCYKYNARGAFIECRDLMGLEGPKHYLNAKLLWNIHSDVDKVLQEWYEAYAGKKAAPYLKAYFQFWEDYWQRKELRNTNWFTTAPATYMQLGEQGTYTYALRKGEMAKLRLLVEKALANAETPQQKKRMKFFRDEVFASVEAAAKCLYSEYLQADGTLANKEDAMALLRSVPDAAKALDFFKNRTIRNKNLHAIAEGGLISNINAVTPYLQDPQIQKEIRRLAGIAALPQALRAQLLILNGKKYPNIFPAGSFEKQYPVPRGGIRSTTHVKEGKYSVMFRNNTLALTAPGIKAGKTYYIAIDVYSKNLSAEGKFFFMAAPRMKKRTVAWKRLTNLKLGKGWQTISFAYQPPARYKNVDNFLFYIGGKNFEADEMLWMDNMRIYALDDK